MQSLKYQHDAVKEKIVFLKHFRREVTLNMAKLQDELDVLNGEADDIRGKMLDPSSEDDLDAKLEIVSTKEMLLEFKIESHKEDVEKFNMIIGDYKDEERRLTDQITYMEHSY